MQIVLLEPRAQRAVELDPGFLVDVVLLLLSVAMLLLRSRHLRGICGCVERGGGGPAHQQRAEVVVGVGGGGCSSCQKLLLVFIVEQRKAVALSKSTKLSYATPGIGSVGHLSGELLTIASGVAMVHVPYKGSGTAVSDLLGGHVQLMFAAPGSMIAHVKSGKLKALAITSEQRISGLEEVPTFGEAGYPPVVAVNWFGVLATAGTPENVVRKINQEIVRIIALPDVRERIISSGYAPVSSTPQEFARFLSAEHVKWQKVIKAAGVRLE